MDRVHSAGPGTGSVRPQPVALRIERVPIDSIAVDPANVRQHPETSLAAISASLRRFGQQKPIVVDEQGLVRAGNGTLLAARGLGWSHIDVVRTSLRGLDAAAYSIADNRTTDLSSFDEPALAQLLGQLHAEDTLEGVGYSPADIDDLLRELGENTPRPVDDQGPEPPLATPVSRTGDLWLLGDHRLLVGDSTLATSYARLLGSERPVLLATDPPYCVEYDGNNRPVHDGKRSGKDWSALYNEVAITDLGEFLDRVLCACLPHVVESAPIYVWHAHIQQPVIAATFERHGLLLHQIIVWTKPAPVFGHSYFQWQHEPCAFGWRKGNKPTHGTSQLSTLWPADWDGKARHTTFHPTSKPTRLFEIPLQLHTRTGDIVLEPFNGSGSQILAAEKLGRRCRAIEVSPHFVDGTVQRWQKATGKSAMLDGTGETFEQVAAARGVTIAPAPEAAS